MPGEFDDILAQLKRVADAGDADAVEALSSQLTQMVVTSIPSDPRHFLVALKKAVESFQHERVGALCEGLVKQLWKRNDVYPSDEAKEILGTLRRKRHFDHIVNAADVFIQTDQEAPIIYRQYGQALLDLGQISAGMRVLESLQKCCEESGGDKKELREAAGLLGRAHKQVYMDAVAAEGAPVLRKKSLEKAIAYYARPYIDDQSNIWHGINTIALLARGQRDEVEIESAPFDLHEEAEAIRSQIAAKKKPNLWDLSTAGEACLALDDLEGALDWIGKYAAEEGADAFELSSTLRQFEEVWQLEDRNPKHAKILNTLRSAVLEREGGSVSLPNPSQGIAAAISLVGDKSYEAVLGNVRYQKFKLLAKGLSQARIVARIETRAGNGHGTGFLFPGPRVHSSIKEDWVLITNAHVISLDPAEHSGHPSALPPDEARVRFEASERPDDIYKLGDILFTSPRSMLDFSIVTLQPQVKLEHDFDIPKALPRIDGRQRVYVIGHPRGQALSVSLHDNILLDHEPPKIHYRSPTEGGSSGSPLFSSAWDLIGLHHAGGTDLKKLNGKPGTYAANEGIWIHSVLRAVAKESD